MMAWWSATPEKKDKTRWKDYRDRNKTKPPMPDVEYGEHLIGYLREFGPASHGGMGLSPVPFFEIKAWAEMVGVTLTSWEVSILRTLSETYCGKVQDAKKPDCPPPWTPTVFDREAVASNIASTLKRIAKRRRKR